MPHEPINQVVLIDDLLKRSFKGRRPTVGVCFNGHAETLERLLALPHRFIVFGEKFHSMFRVMERAAESSGGALRDDIVFLEARFSALPLAPLRLDALVLLGGMPSGIADRPLQSLAELRGLLKPGGLLIWPEVVGEGFFGRLACTRKSKQKGTVSAPECTDLCRLTMEAGFVDIGQIPLKTRAVPWTVTHGRTASRPWEAGIVSY